MSGPAPSDRTPTDLPHGSSQRRPSPSSPVRPDHSPADMSDTGPIAGPTNAGPTDIGRTNIGPTSSGPTSSGPTSSGPTITGPISTGPMPSGPNTGPVESIPQGPPLSGSISPGPPPRKHSRIGAAWVALIVATIVLIFFLIFVLQNSDPVDVKYLGFTGTMQLGVAMMFAAVAGALTAGLLGTVRILQLRSRARKAAIHR